MGASSAQDSLDENMNMEDGELQMQPLEEGSSIQRIVILIGGPGAGVFNGLNAVAMLHTCATIPQNSKDYRQPLSCFHLLYRQNISSRRAEKQRLVLY